MIAGTTSAYAKPQVKSISQSEVKFENKFRRLWIDHVLWTSNYITSATTAGAEDQKQVLKRLLKNQEEIGNAVKPVYGEKAGNKLTALLKELKNLPAFCWSFFHFEGHLLTCLRLVNTCNNRREGT